MGVKQVIVMRNDLNMRKGKMIAQGAHAAMKVFFDRGDLGYYWRSGASGSLFEGEDDPGNPGAFAMLITLTRAMWAWANGSFTKVVVRADSEEQLLDLYRQAREAHLPVALVEDAGKTEFHGVVTPTCIAIGPADPADIDLITGDLKLL
jgi:peptidyl-tRNA hydrolase, PTH2 family